MIRTIKEHLPEEDFGGVLHTRCGLVVQGIVRLGDAAKTDRRFRCKKCWKAEMAARKKEEETHARN